MWCKWALLALCCFPVHLLAGEQHFYNFGGVNSQDDPLLIDDRDAVDAMNVLTDEGDLRTMYGTTLLTTVSTAPVTFLKEWTNTSGQRILFAQSGTSLFATSPSSGSFITLKNFGGSVDLDAVAAFKRVYFVDGTNSPFYTTGSSTTLASGLELCKYTEQYQTRLVCVNTTTDTSRVALSAYNDPTNWTTTSSKDSAALKYFHKDDGEGVNCVFTTPAGLFIGKNSSVGMLKGDSNDTFYWREIADDVGCVDDRTVQIVDGTLVWLSRSGFYAWDFNGPPVPISRKITPSTKLIRKSGSTDSVWTINSKTGWEEGTTTGWDTVAYPGALHLANYNSGALGTTTSYFLPGMFTNSGFESNNFSNWSVPPFTTVGNKVMDLTAGMLCPHGSYCGYDFVDTIAGDGTEICGGLATSTAAVTVINASDDSVIFTVLGSSQVGVASARQDTTISSPTIAGSGNIKIVIHSSLGTVSTSTAFNRNNGVAFTFGRIASTLGSGSCYDFFDTHEGPAPAISTSQVYDTGLSSPTLLIDFQASTSAVMTWSVSSDSVTFISTTVAQGGSLPSGYSGRYFKYHVFLPASYYGIAYSSFTSLTVYTAVSTQSYLSPVKYMSEDIAAFKLFTVSDLETGASPIYSVRSASYTYVSTDTLPAWTVQPINTSILASTGAYSQFKINPNVTTSTQVVTAYSVSWAYTLGSAAPLAASVVDDHRYLASVSHNSTTVNDIIYVWQKNKEWTFAGAGLAAMTRYNNRPIGGSTLDNSKVWYIMDPAGRTFDGNSIDAYWQTKSFTFGQMNNHKVLDRVWISAENSGMTNFGVAWMGDLDGVWHSTTTSLSSSSFVQKEVEGLFETANVGRQISFKFSGNELDSYFKLKLFSIYFTVNPLIKD